MNTIAHTAPTSTALTEETDLALVELAACELLLVGGGNADVSF
jgi:hypothetical protein